MSIKTFSPSYPSSNPFPKTLVVSLEGRTEVEVLPSAENLCTVELNPFLIAKKEVGTYLDGYKPTVREEGMALGIKGDHGSGKTHLVRYLMEASQLSDHQVIQVYVKVESPDFWSVYRDIIAQIEYWTLREANTKWLSQLGQNEARLAKISQSVVDVLGQNPATVERYLDATLLSPEVIEGYQRQAVLDITYNEDFYQALFYLRDPMLAHEAYHWLRGDKLSDHDLRRLGVEDNLNSQDIEAALRLLVTLLSYARHSFLLYIDQFERLLRNTSSDVKLTNIGILKSLAEIFVREQGFLCLAGAIDAWQQFSKDFLDRLHLVELTSLSFNDALNIIKLYLISFTSQAPFKPYSSEEEIYPYTEKAVREMLSIAHGNLRRFLHLAHDTFEKAFPNKALIEHHKVTEVIKLPLVSFDLDSFLAQLDAPGGGVRLRDRLYVERAADAELRRELLKWGSTTTIHAPRQTGKTSLLVHGLHYAKKKGVKVVLFHFESLSEQQLSESDLFLRTLAEMICRNLRLNVDVVKQAWQVSGNAQQKLTYFLEDHVLPAFDVPIILAMDHADSLLQTDFYRDFFGLVRSWHDRRAFDPELWEKLNIVLSISTEPYLLINDINQSPFNVGLKINLEDFNTDQVQTLNQQHGSPVKAGDFTHFMTFLGGQPYLTLQALYTLLKQNISWGDLVSQSVSDDGSFGSHLREMYAQIRDAKELKHAFKQIIRTSSSADKESCFRLLRAGLIKRNDKGYICRCELYRHYFERKLS